MLKLDWSLERAPQGDALIARYTVHNGGAEPVWILDDMVTLAPDQGLAPAPRAVVVVADASDPTLVHLIRGRVEPRGRPRMELIPGARALAPGASLTGEAQVALPLQRWHPNEGGSALAQAPTRAVLSLGVLPGDVETDERPVGAGVQQEADPGAARADQALLAGAVLSLP